MNALRLLLVLALVGCRSPSATTWNPAGSDTTLVARLAAIRALDPEAQARNAILRRDYTLLGVQEFTLSVPGFRGDLARYTQGAPVRVIEGTSDEVSGELDEQYQRAAAAYAERYNVTIVTNRGP